MPVLPDAVLLWPRADCREGGSQVKIPDQYIGDGVYASYDGYHVVLDLRGQDDTTRIALEPPVLNALFAYVEFIKKHSRDEESKGQK